MSEPLSDFHLFPKLPPELQLRIWELAVVPRVITLQIEDRNQVYHHSDPATGFKVTSPDIPMLSTCQDSRQIALKAYSTGHCIASQNRSITPRPSLGRMYFDPSRDTILFADLESFIYMVNECEVVPGPTPLPWSWHPSRSAAPIHSLAINGMFERAGIATFLSNPSLRHVEFWQINEAVERSRMQGHLSSHLEKIETLQELIFVNPPSQELSRRPRFPMWKELQETDPLFGIVLATLYRIDEILYDDPAETERCIQDLLSLVTNVVLKYPGLCLHYSYLDPITFFDDDIAPLQRELKEWWDANRKWWDNPVVTSLTEEEFRARFA
jgi:hypothetical protein